SNSHSTPCSALRSPQSSLPAREKPKTCSCRAFCTTALTPVFILSILVGWPLLGFLVGSVTGDLTAWHRDPGIVRVCSRLTWLLVIPCVLRVAVQYPLYLGDHIGWL